MLICDILDRANETAEELSSLGEVHVHVGDLTQRDVCAAAVVRAVELFGGLHVVVNNAGIARWGPFLEHSEEDWDRTLDVNLKAVFLLSQQAARVMVDQGDGGVILSTASNNGHTPEPDVAAYNASKGAVVLLTKTMAIELAKYNIRANCVSPGHIGPTDLSLEGGADETFFETLKDGIPLGRLGKLEEVAAPLRLPSIRRSRIPSTATASSSTAANSQDNNSTMNTLIDDFRPQPSELLPRSARRLQRDPAAGTRSSQPQLWRLLDPDSFRRRPPRPARLGTVLVCRRPEFRPRELAARQVGV